MQIFRMCMCLLSKEINHLIKAKQSVAMLRSAAAAQFQPQMPLHFNEIKKNQQQQKPCGRL